MGNFTWEIHTSSCRYDIHPNYLRCVLYATPRLNCSDINYKNNSEISRSFFCYLLDQRIEETERKKKIRRSRRGRYDGAFPQEIQSAVAHPNITNQLNFLALSSSIYILPLLMQLERQQSPIISLTPFAAKAPLTEAGPIGSQGYLRAFLDLIEVLYSLFTLVQNI